MLALKNGRVVTGDGKTDLPRATVLSDRGRILDVLTGEVSPSILERCQRVIDCAGKLVIPGVINHHTHACHYGPLWPSASERLPEEKVQYYLDKSLLEGSTTIMNVCGFATVTDTEAACAAHPLRVRTGTTYTPSNVAAADSIDGKGFEPRHRKITAEDQVKAGAVAIAEVGGGMTLAGGGMEYHYIPAAIKQVTGKTLESKQARKLKEAVLGRFADPADYSESALVKALDELGLTGLIGVEQTRQLIVRTVMPSLGPALDGFDEGLAEAKKFGLRVLIHNAPQSMRRLQKVCREGGDLVIAAHSNHSNFEFPEALENARIMRGYGAIIDVATLDAWGAKKLQPTPDLLYEFYRQDLVDLLSTDFAAGLCDGVLVGVEHTVKVGAASLAKVIATCTSRASEVFPLLAPERGIIARDWIADLVITDPVAVSKVDTVIIGGSVVVENGKRV